MKPIPAKIQRMQKKVANEIMHGDWIETIEWNCNGFLGYKTPRK